MSTIIVLGMHCSKIVATEKLESLTFRKLTGETRQIKDVRGKSGKSLTAETSCCIRVST